MNIKKLKSGYAIYDNMGKRQTAFVPDDKSAKILLKAFKEYEQYEPKTKQRGMKP